MKQKRLVIIAGLLLLVMLASAACLRREQPIPTATPILMETAAPATSTTAPSLTATFVSATTPGAATETVTLQPPTATPAVTDAPVTATATISATPVVQAPASVHYIMALTSLNLRSGPGLNYAVVGWMRNGQIARVNGASSDGGWWQLECPGGAAATCWVTADSAYSKPQPDATRIQFPTGATSEMVSGSMMGTEQAHYVLWAGGGQTMRVEVDSPGDSVLFQLQGLADGQIYKGMLSGELSWQGVLPQSQDYLLALNAVGEVSSYTIHISITDGAPPTATATATATSEADTAPGGPLYPVVDAESGYLLGGTQFGSWIDAETYAGYLQDTERPYSLYTLGGYQGMVSGSTPPPPGGVCPQPVVPLESDTNLSGGVALVATWDAAPRLAELQPADTADYREVVTGILQEAGLADPQVQIDRILRIDLEGDGVDEILIEASRLTAGTRLPPVAAGDYSLLLLRKVANGMVFDVPLGLDVYPEAQELAYPFRYSVLGLLDLSGDGYLEILVAAERYEGRQVTVYEITPAGLQEVLQAGCVQ